MSQKLKLLQYPFRNATSVECVLHGRKARDDRQPPHTYLSWRQVVSGCNTQRTFQHSMGKAYCNNRKQFVLEISQRRKRPTFENRHQPLPCLSAFNHSHPDTVWRRGLPKSTIFVSTESENLAFCLRHFGPGTMVRSLKLPPRTLLMMILYLMLVPSRVHSPQTGSIHSPVVAHQYSLQLDDGTTRPQATSADIRDDRRPVVPSIIPTNKAPS